jgi:membrane associated rhomboid family serine protease
VPEVTKNNRDGLARAQEKSTSGGPLVNAPLVVLVLIAVLLIINLLLQIGGPNVVNWAQNDFALIVIRFAGGAQTEMIPGSQYWSLITYAFLHEGWMHVLGNSLWLLVFGTPVARQFGALRFLAVALVSTLGGALAMLWVYWGVNIIVVGASAAVSGLLAAAIPIMFGRPGAPLTFGELLRDRRALVFTFVFLGMTLFTGVQELPGFADSGRIAWEAHIGGFVAGLLSYFILNRERMQKR